MSKALICRVSGEEKILATSILKKIKLNLVTLGATNTSKVCIWN